MPGALVGSVKQFKEGFVLAYCLRVLSREVLQQELEAAGHIASAVRKKQTQDAGGGGYMCVCECVSVQASVCMCVCSHEHVCECVYSCMCKCVSGCVHTSVSVGGYKCMGVHV